MALYIYIINTLTTKCIATTIVTSTTAITMTAAMHCYPSSDAAAAATAMVMCSTNHLRYVLQLVVCVADQLRVLRNLRRRDDDDDGDGVLIGNAQQEIIQS